SAEMSAAVRVADAAIPTPRTPIIPTKQARAPRRAGWATSSTHWAATTRTRIPVGRRSPSTTSAVRPAHGTSVDSPRTAAPDPTSATAAARAAAVVPEARGGGAYGPGAGPGAGPAAGPATEAAMGPGGTRPGGGRGATGPGGAGG